MFKTKLIISISIFFILLITTSVIKNKTRIIEKKIYNLSDKILLNKKNINEAQLEFYYLTSPKEIEIRLNIIGFDNYYPIAYSKIFLNISDFIYHQNKISNLREINEKKIQKN